eukprot:scaffold42566_cov197-Skeletonema_marinoi.AAC.1
METITVASKKRSHSLISKDLECTKDHDITIDHDATAESETNTKSETMQQKRTITEERLHPEEALFLHMRGLLRIEYNHETMSTQDLFCQMLPECKISLPAYLAYAHLRAQGYILIRYSAERIKLLLARSLNAREKDSSNIAEGGEKSNDNNEVSESTQNTDIDNSSSSNIAEGGEKGYDNNLEVSESTKHADIDNSSSSNIAEGGENSNDNKLEVSESTKNADIHNSSNNSWRQAKQKLSDDVATASPPCVVLFDEWNSNYSHDLNTRLAYFAYNPNSNFRRSNPGLPDFGVAIMPFQSSGVSVPSFDTISALVALCENKQNDAGDETEDSITAASNEIPLRIATVADCGAVIVYGVTRGDVPVIDKKKNDK